MFVFVEEAAETVAATDAKPGELVWVRDWFGQDLPHRGRGDRNPEGEQLSVHA